jgi:4'-phosphopantetheinyl transferase
MPQPQPTEARVDVWQADLAVAGAAERAPLSPDERARAERFARPADGERWAAARGILRLLLAAYADTEPDALRFAAGAHGKPALAEPSRLRFNLSHAGDVALYAVTLGCEVGVDVELPRARGIDEVAIARRTLGDAEAERLADLPPQRRERAFLRAWTRWEAVLKCRGTGIGGADELADGPAPWVHDLDVDPPAAAALAVAGGPHEVCLLRWPPDG